MTRDIEAPVTIALPRPRPEGRPLDGQYCSLRRTTLADADDLFAAFDQAGDWVHLPYGPFETVQDLRLWLIQTCLRRDPLFYTLHVGGRAAGVASLMRIAPDHGVVEVGHIHYAPRLQGTPAATEAMALLMRHVFEDLGYRRYEWKCNAANSRSRAAALRLGFTEEGTFRQHMVIKGQNRDTTWFSILDSEWPALRDRFTAWLDPANFDAEGRQIRALRDCGADQGAD